MGKRTEEMLEKTSALHSRGWKKRRIAKECGVSPQYVGKLIKIHEQNQSNPSTQSYGLSIRVLNCLKRNNIPIDPHVIADSIGLLLCMRGLGKCALSEIGMMLKGFNIIHDIDEWREDGKEKLYNQHKTSFRDYSRNLPNTGYNRRSLSAR